jgi:predicted permease
VASVATVQLARVAKRRREMTVRAALGATPARLTRQWLTESAVIGAAGGLLGVAGARLLIGLLPAVLPADFPRLSEITLDWRVALASTTATLAAIAVCGLVPALHARHVDLVQSLTDDNLAPVGGGMRTPVARLRAGIMAAQIAVACVLLIGAGLLGRSLQSLVNVDRGYDPSNLLTVRLPLPSGSTYAKNGAMLQGITERLRALPGVTHASFGNALPLVSAGSLSGFSVRLPRDPSTIAKVQTLHRTVDPEYFRAMGLRLRAGRLLRPDDTETSQPVLVVNRSFAEQYLGDDPIGRRLPLSLYRQAEWAIVGVVEDMQQGGLETARLSGAGSAQPEMFSSYRQFGSMRLDSIFLIARGAGDPVALAPSVRAIVREQAPALVLDPVVTMEDRLMSSLSRPRAYAFVLGGLAAFALAIAAVGLFGVLSYSVAQRSREIGVRTALGARTVDIVGLVLRSGMAITAVGLTGGLAAAALLAGSISKILYGVRPFDPATFIAVPLLLALAAALACVGPARRAARIDPIRALRSE